MMRLFLVSLFAASVWSSCQSETVITSSQPQMAQKLYVTKCAKCHELYDPKKYSDADWDLWMTKMRKKSKLKPDQFALIQAYTKMFRAPETGAITNSLKP
ncbi:MAG: hypothetical protein ABI042_12055 [Verrucomicrobiota bacterium]